MDQWDLHDQINRTVTAAHGLSGWLLGSMASRLFGRNYLECNPKQADIVVKQALDIDLSEKEAKQRFGDSALFMIWIGWRDEVRIQRFNPVLATRSGIIYIARKLLHTPFRKRSTGMGELLEEVVYLERYEKECREGRDPLPWDVDHQIDRAIEAADRIAKWLHQRHGAATLSCDVSDEEALRVLGDYERYVLWSGYRDAVRLARFKPVREIKKRLIDAAKKFAEAPLGKQQKHLRVMLREVSRLRRAERECAALFPEDMSREMKHPPLGKTNSEEKGGNQAPT